MTEEDINKGMEQQIIDIIKNSTDNWQPHGKPESCFIIEEQEPFFWRLNPRWIKEVTDKILDIIKEDNRKSYCRQSIIDEVREKMPKEIKKKKGLVEMIFRNKKKWDIEVLRDIDIGFNQCRQEVIKVLSKLKEE